MVKVLGTPEDGLISRKFIWVPLTCVNIYETSTLRSLLSILDYYPAKPEGDEFVYGSGEKQLRSREGIFLTILALSVGAPLIRVSLVLHVRGDYFDLEENFWFPPPLVLLLLSNKGEEEVLNFFFAILNKLIRMCQGYGNLYHTGGGDCREGWKADFFQSCRPAYLFTPTSKSFSNR
jgi:hypothetical protein